MIKIAIFSDIHSNFEALEAILNDINKNGFNEVVCLGDVLAIGPNPKECLDLIINSNVKMILGNHELYYVLGTDIDKQIFESEKQHQNWVASNLGEEHKKFLMNCNLEYKIKTNDLNISFKHFLINNNSTEKYPFHSTKIIHDEGINEVLKSELADIIFFGHEHNGTTLMNNSKKAFGIGSSGCRKDDKTHYTILTISGDKYNVKNKIITYNRAKFEEKMNDSNYPEKESISKIFFGIGYKKRRLKSLGGIKTIKF